MEIPPQELENFFGDTVSRRNPTCVAFLILDLITFWSSREQMQFDLSGFPNYISI